MKIASKQSAVSTQHPPVKGNVNHVAEKKDTSSNDHTNSFTGKLSRFRFLHVIIMVLGIILSLRVINVIRNFITGYGATVVVSSSISNAEAKVDESTEKSKGEAKEKSKGQSNEENKDDTQEEAAPKPEGMSPLNIEADLPLTFDTEDGKTAGLPFDPLMITDAEMQVLKNLRTRRKQLEQKENDIKAHYALMEIAERNIERKLKDLENLKAQLEEELKKEDETTAEEVKRLVKMYESMKPQDVARVFDELPMPVLQKVLKGMNNRRIAQIMNFVKAERVKALTVSIVKRSLDNEARRELLEGSEN